ncbi:MAG: assimilatory sulfite reductase (NADPH) flavoprotein subunit [Oceanipulchritudo sp.]
MKTLPEGAPLDPGQTKLLNGVLPTLTQSQAAWLSGYLASLGRLSSPAGPAVVGGVPLTILFGSESGNAESCAAEAAKAARKAGFEPTIADMADYPPESLSGEKQLLIIVSTWGEGDPPEGAVGFHEFVMGEKAPRLKGTHFAVFALGDTSYADFCECGKQFDRRLEELGGRRVLDRVDADVDYEPAFRKWLEAVMPRISGLAGASTPVPVAEILSPDLEAPAEAYGKKNPFPAEVKDLVLLNGWGSAKETFHVELSLKGSGMSYVPGDVVGIFPVNCPEVVEDLLGVAGLEGDREVELDDGRRRFRDVLARERDITSVNLPLLKKYAPLAGNRELDALLESGDKPRIQDWLHGREIRDLFLEFPPAKSISAEDLLGILRKMPPRLYSIASSLRAHPEEVHLTVGSVLYDSHGRRRKGVCSTYLCQRIRKGDTVSLYTHHNKNFGLPEDGDAPLIMIGPGTGIAPFRAFLEEREALGAKGRNWLFFGDQHFNSDFLYQLEWMDYLQKGILTRMDVAFSRDTDHKIYVQHRMMENSRQLYAWLQEGAFFYVCGDANRMARDVHQALIDIHVKEGGLSNEAAEQAVRILQKDKRYQRDVY